MLLPLSRIPGGANDMRSQVSVRLRSLRWILSRGKRAVVGTSFSPCGGDIEQGFAGADLARLPKTPSLTNLFRFQNSQMHWLASPITRVWGGSGRRGAAALTRLQKQNLWSLEIERDKAWERRRGLHNRGSALWQGRSVTDDELRGCINLGFGFEASGCAACGARRSRLVKIFPTLDLYYAVHGGDADGRAKGFLSSCAYGASSKASEESPLGSPMSMLSPGDMPETVKMRLKQWVQVVALSLRNHS